jgi:phage-related tail fiber protein
MSRSRTLEVFSMTNSTQALLESVANFDARVKAKLDLKLDTLGTSAKAKVLETARNFYISGDGIATGAFDGSSSVTLNLALKNSGVVASQAGNSNTIPIITVNAKGIVTALSSQPVRRTVIPLGNVNELPASGETDTLYLIRSNGSTVMYRWTGVSYENMTATMSVAATANALTNIRQINIVGDVEGSVGFDGSTDVSITTLLLNTGVSPGVYSKVTVDAKGRVTNGDALSVSDIPLLNQDTTGDSNRSNSLITPRTIALQGDATGTVSFDGSSNVQIVVTVTDNSHLHTVANISGLDAVLAGFAPLNSPVFTGTPTAPAPMAGTNTTQVSTTAFVQSTVSANAPSKAGIGATGTWGIAISGNAATATLAASATKLATPRAIGTTGDATGSVYFDGTGAVNIPLVLAASGVVAGIWKKVTVDSKGRVTAGSELLAADIPLLNQDTTGLAATATKLAIARAISVSGDVTGTVNFDGSGAVIIPVALTNSGVSAGTANNSATANAPLTIDAKGRVTEIGAGVIITPAWTSVTGKPTTLVGYGITDSLLLGNVVGSTPATAAIGVSTAAARADHVHPLQTAISGNAGTATKLITTRAITLSGDATGTVNFDGSAAVAIATTLAASGVVAGTYNSATTISPVTVDTKGRVTTVGTAVTITPDWNDVTGKPTSIEGYGISDANDVREYTSFANFPVTGVVSKIYVDNTTNKLWRWTGSNYSELSKPVASTTEVLEGNNLYFTNARAQAAVTTITGNASTATKLAAARAIAVSGDAAGTINFDGSAGVTIPLVLTASGVTPGTYNNSTTANTPLTIDAKGRVTSVGAGVIITPAWVSITGKPSTIAGYGISDAQLLSQKGAANGYASLDSSGLVPASQLPSYVDDVLEYATMSLFPATGETSKIYIDTTTNKTWRWGGTVYVEISASPGSTDSVTEGTTNLYFTSARAQAAVTTIAGNAATATKLATPRAITLSGDTTGTVNFDGSAAIVIASTLTASGVSAGTYNNSATTNTPLTVDVKGRVTATGAGVTITPAWGSITGKPTTLAGYGITDGDVLEYVAKTNFPVTGVVSKIYVDNTTNKLWRWDGTVYLELAEPIANTTVLAEGTNLYFTNARAQAAVTTVAGNAGTATKLATTRAISVSGDATGSVNFDGSAAVAIPLVLAASGVTAGVANNSATANAPLTIDAKGRVTSVGAAVTITPAFASITGKPTTLAGYGITDAASSTALNASALTSGTLPDARLVGAYTGMTNLTGSGSVDFAKFLGNPADTVALPSYTFTGDTDTGLYSPAADQIGISCGGVQRLLVNASGITAVGSLITALNGSAISTGTVAVLRGGTGVTTSTGSGSNVLSANPTFSGAPATPTAIAGTNNTQIANTAFVTTAIAGEMAGNAATATALATTRAISVSGDATGTVNFDGSAAVAIPLVLAASGVTAGTYNNSATANTPLTIDSKGRVTATGAGVTITPAFASITGKPTTLAGYGITDGASSAGGPNYQSTSRVSFLNGGSAQAISVGNLLCSDTYSDASLVPVNGFYAKGNITSAGVFNGNGSGLTSVTANTLIGDQTNWVNYRANAVANMLGWKNYGNGHVIFDASQSTSPTGSTVGNTNAAVEWTPAYPTLMGWNGTSTYGVRVDSARIADTLQTARTINGVSFNGSANITVADATKMPVAGGSFTGLVGTASINSTMAVNDSSSSLEVRNVVSATGDAGMAMVAFHAQGTYALKMGLRADGYFGIGGWSRAAWSWYTDPSGNMVAAGNVSAYSDPRLKENFKRVEKPLIIIGKLDGGTFDWKHGFAHTQCKAGKHDYGILADQVEAVMPEIVTTSIEIEGESYRTVDYSKIVPVLIESTKELHAMILELKAEIAELRQSV